MLSSGSNLALLEHADLIRRLLELDEAYQFKHNLIQESAYASLLRNDRRTLHRAAAQALESTYAHELDANAALLAKHYAEAGDEEKTYRYARRAGDAARRLSAFDEALMQYDTAALLASRLPVPTAEFVELHQARGRTLELMSQYEEAKAAYRALYDIGTRRNEPQIVIGALLPLATLQTFPNETQNLPTALAANQEALQLARESGDASCETRALWNMVLYSYFAGHIAEAVRYGQEGLVIADRYGLREMRAYILNDMSRALISHNSVTEALEALAQARVIWMETENLPMLADNLASTSEMLFVGGDMEGFERFYNEAIELCQTIGNVWNLTYAEGSRLQSSANQGDFNDVVTRGARVKELARTSGFVVSTAIVNVVQAIMIGELGMPKRAIEFLDQQARISSFHLMEPWRLGTLAHLNIMLGNLDKAAQDLAQARTDLAPDDISNYGPIYIALCGGELALARGDFAGAVGETEPGLERLRAARVRYLYPEMLFTKARGHIGLEEWDTAARALDEAVQVAESMGNRQGLWQILATRAELETARGNMEAAQAARHAARRHVEWIVEHSPAEYHASFLARPLVKYVYGTD